MSENWIVQNLEHALETWNDKLGDIWLLITQSPEEFKGGTIWNVITDIHGALQAIGYSLLVLFFVVGVMKTCGSFAELKHPEIALKMFIRFVLAKTSISYGLELMMALLSIVQGIISKIMDTSGLTLTAETVLPDSIITAIEDFGFWESVPLWAVPASLKAATTRLKSSNVMPTAIAISHVFATVFSLCLVIKKW